MTNIPFSYRLSLVATAFAASIGAAHAVPATIGASPCGTVNMAPLVKIAVGKASVVKLNTPVSRILLGNPENSAAGRPTAARENTSGVPSVANNTQQNNRRPGVADVDIVLLSPNELYLLGKAIGSTNVTLLDRAGRCTVIDVAVGIDNTSLSATLSELLPDEKQIKVSSAGDAVVLSGNVSDAGAADRAVSIAVAYARRIGAGQAGSRASAQDSVINMLSVAAPQQVMLEVKVAEVSKALLDQFGINFARAYSPANGNMIGFLSGILGGGPLVATAVSGATNALVGAGAASAATGGAALSGITAPDGSIEVTNGVVTKGSIIAGRNATNMGVNAQKQDGLIKVLAEPTVMAISGQKGDFLAGGKIFLPVASNNSSGGTTITLEEKTFGIGLSFVPTVLGDGRINLKLHSEVSELNAQGVAITATNVAGTAILPSFSVRSTDTTVQLMDGQSFAIGGLIKNNITANVTAFPFLGELPILGTLFRSTSFQNDRSELVFVITPRLVKPLPPNYALPTDGFIEPSRTDIILRGRLEGSSSNQSQEKPTAAPEAPTEASTGGFEVK